MGGSCKHGNEALSSTDGEEVTEKLSDYRLL